MEEIDSLLRKLQRLNRQQPKTRLDIELMLDYTRRLYDVLLELQADETPETRAPAAPAMEVIDLQPDPGAAAIQQEPPFVPPRPMAEPASPAVPLKPPAVPQDIRNHIAINEKYQLLNELFRNDQEAYQAAIEAINTSNTAAEAIDWLHAHVSWNYNWSEENETVQLFYNLITNFFAQRS
jgi:hypothetical protein